MGIVMRLSALVLPLGLFLACATSQQASRGTGENAAPGENPENVVQATISQQDGTSFEHAIVIDAATEKEGGPLEFRWINEHFPGFRLIKQSVTRQEGKAYDVVQLTDASGTEHVVYFDISSFIGKK